MEHNKDYANKISQNYNYCNAYYLFGIKIKN